MLHPRDVTAPRNWQRMVGGGCHFEPQFTLGHGAVTPRYRMRTVDGGCIFGLQFRAHRDVITSRIW